MSDKKTMKALLLRRHGSLDDLDVVSDYPVPAAVGDLVHPHAEIRAEQLPISPHTVSAVLPP